MGKGRGLRRGWWLLMGMLLMVTAGCGGKGGSAPRVVRPAIRQPAGPPPVAKERDLALLGYTIQAGAFSNLDNAVRLMMTLQGQGLQAYYFKHRRGLYKVRFGNFPNRQEALARANFLRKSGLIQEFYIVSPEEYSVAHKGRYGDSYLRQRLVYTAEQFLGIPYKWGGESAEDGFDCSGLAMTVYQMNGLDLPRNSRQQYDLGRGVAKDELQPGDLVFFATNGDGRVTHVGIYRGEGRFIHAPKMGRSICIASLADPYFADTYLGARSYMATAGGGG